jgi:hypothetical protein
MFFMSSVQSSSQLLLLNVEVVVYVDCCVGKHPVLQRIGMSLATPLSSFQAKPTTRDWHGWRKLETPKRGT